MVPIIVSTYKSAATAGHRIADYGSKESAGCHPGLPEPLAHGVGVY